MNPRARLGAALLLAFVVVALFGPLLLPLDRLPVYEQRFLPLSLAHPLGTDYAGRDVLAQLVHGSRDILAIAFCTGAVALLLGCGVGIGSALLGGSADALLMGFTDVVLTVPTFPVMAIASALFRIDNPLAFGTLLAVFSWPGLARSLRAQTVALQGREFVEMARLLRLGNSHILLHEILPNLVPFLALNFILIARNAITASVGIMLLGLVPLRVENWGMMLNLAAFQSGALFLPQGRAYLLAPLGAIVLFQYALILFASGVEEFFDPRLKRL
jgi:peptide/nickel transport system permease protein